MSLRLSPTLGVRLGLKPCVILFPIHSGLGLAAAAVSDWPIRPRRAQADQPKAVSVHEVYIYIINTVIIIVYASPGASHIA